ncbi:MAG TPA: UDP-2,3-diacylglucosamine diphosphatase LpxI [Candidatus Acidoferrales bacterium]|nr:UDP-2,3-diacylglucosamine diphosphatase LpxI [Candidatus Acidoferrales bacterium]
MERVGLIAGSGSFPLVFADEARRLGFAVVAVAHIGETVPELESHVEKIFWVRVGQLGRVISVFKQESITRAVMAGAIKKSRFFTNVRPDLRALRILRHLRERKDDFVLRAVADELEKEGITIEGATKYVPSLLAPPGVLSRRAPRRQEWGDLEFGFRVGREIARSGVGQCIVVKRRAVLAVEAIEGTDQTILRGGRFAKGAIVIKVCKPQQDLRFDLPTVGPGTIAVMREAKAACLGIEVGKTVMLEKDAMIAEADAAGIAVVGLDGM